MSPTRIRSVVRDVVQSWTTVGLFVVVAVLPLADTFASPDWHIWETGYRIEDDAAGRTVTAALADGEITPELVELLRIDAARIEPFGRDSSLRSSPSSHTSPD